MKSIDDLDRLYREAMKAVAPKPDPSKGLTAREWAARYIKDADQLGDPRQSAMREIRKLKAMGRIVESKDWRPFNGDGWRKERVYLIVEPKRKAKR